MVGENTPRPLPKEYLRVANVEGQPLRELTTTPSVCRAGDRVPESPLEPLRAETDGLLHDRGRIRKSSTTPGIEHYSPSATKIEAGPRPKNRTA